MLDANSNDSTQSKPPEKDTPADPATTQDSTSAAGFDSTTNKPLVLVIDDNDLVRRIIVEMLKSLSYRVAEAETGEQGLALVKTADPDAVIIDFLLPGIDGVQVAQQARELKPALPLIFLSGYFDTLAHEAIRGAVSLRKPVSIDVLRRNLERLLAI